jgi:hypothetical protein
MTKDISGIGHDDASLERPRAKKRPAGMEDRPEAMNLPLSRDQQRAAKLNTTR